MVQFNEIPEIWSRALFEDSPVPTVLISPDHFFSRSNHAFCGIVGYTEGELKKRKWTSITHPDDLDGDFEAADSLKRERDDSVYTIYKRYITKKGSVVGVNLHVRGIWGDEKFIGYLVIACPTEATNQTPATIATRPFSLKQWASKNPKDAAIVGLASLLFLGRDQLIRLIELWLSK